MIRSGHTALAVAIETPHFRSLAMIRSMTFASSAPIASRIEVNLSIAALPVTTRPDKSFNAGNMEPSEAA